MANHREHTRIIGLVYPAGLSGGSGSSPWVGKEVDFWRHNKAVEKLLIVQTEGEIAWDAGASDFNWLCTTALPKRLMGAFTDEPRWIDARWARTATHTSLRDPRFRDLVAELAAPLRGVPKDELIGEDIRQVKRLARWRNAAFGLLSVLMIGAIAAAVVAVQERQLAEQRLAPAQRNESKALATLADRELDGSGPTTTVRIALAALPQNATSGDRPYVAEAEAALMHGMQHLRERRRFSDGESPVDAAALSPDDRLLVIGLQDGTIQLWDVATGKELRILRSADESKTTTSLNGGNTGITSDEPDAVKLAIFSADGRTIITADAYATARVWEVASGRELATFRAIDQLKLPFNDVSAASSLDGRFVALNGARGPDANTVLVWDVASGKPIILHHDLDPDDHRKGLMREVSFAAFSADGHTLVTGSSDSSIRVWDLPSGRKLTALQGHTGPLVFAAFSADGRTLVTAAKDHTARLWELTSGRQLAEFRGHGGAITGAALSPDGHLLVTASEDRTARLWDVTAGKEVAVLRGHQAEVRSAAFSADGRFILTTSADGTVRLWQADPAKEVAVLRSDQYMNWGILTPDGHSVLTKGGNSVRLWDATTTGEDVTVLKGHEQEVRSVAFSPDGQTVATAGWDDTARLWDVRSRRETAVLHHPVFNVEFAAFSPDGRFVLTIAGDGIARLWDAALATEVKTLRPGKGIYFATFSADSHTIFTVDGDKAIREWDLSSSDKVIAHYTESQKDKDGHFIDYEYPLAVSPDGRTLLIHAMNNENGLWDLASGKIAWVLPQEGEFDRTRFSPGGRRLVTLNRGVAQVWDATSGQRLAVIRNVESVVFSPDANSIVTAASDGIIRLWDAASGQELMTIGVHKGAKAAVFSPDDHSVVTAAEDVRIWPLMPRRQQLIDRACAQVPWPLSALQRERFGITDEDTGGEFSRVVHAAL